MDKQTLSNYGWIVIAVLVLVVMIALATPFGEYVKSAVWNTTTALFETEEKALDVVINTIQSDTETTPDIGFEDSGDNDSETELPPSLDDEGAGGTSGDSYENMFG